MSCRPWPRGLLPTARLVGRSGGRPQGSLAARPWPPCLSSATMPLQISGPETQAHKTSTQRHAKQSLTKPGVAQFSGLADARRQGLARLPSDLLAPQPRSLPGPPSAPSVWDKKKKKKSCVKKKKKKITSELFLARAPLVLLSDFSLARARKLLAGGGLC